MVEAVVIAAMAEAADTNQSRILDLKFLDPFQISFSSDIAKRC